MAKIFISYRRADSETIVGRIYDRLIGRFGVEMIFKDVDSIPLGMDFQQYIGGIIRQCAVELVIIGPRWLDITDATTGRRRLDDPADNVRLEIEAALAAGIVIIPLLVERATMPDSERLPESLRPLATRNGRPVRNDPDFNRDIEHVLAALEQYAQNATGPGAGTAASTSAGTPADPQTALVRQLLPEMERAYADRDWLGVRDRANYLARHAPNAVPASAYLMWGIALFEEGDLAEARGALDHALGLDASGNPSRPFAPQDLPALIPAATIRVRAGEPAAAEPLLADALVLAGADPTSQLTILREYVAVERALGKWDEVQRRAAQAQRLAPDDRAWPAARLDALTHLGRTEDALAVARQLAERPADWVALARLTAETTHHNRNAIRAVLDEADRRFPDGDAALAAARRELLPPLVPRERFPKRLERLGFAAAERENVGLIVPPVCPVPAGPFLMGSDPKQDSQAYDSEKPQQQVALAAFAIGTFPVTVAEYACFVDAGHAEPLEGLFGTDWQTQLTRLDHPVTCVSWHDATAYAAWLARLTGQPWALPSEAQWEKAARWDPARRASRLYPWGDRFEAARCNTSESSIGTTTAVGSYGPENPARDGSSPCGAQDMAGNVWEWTSTLYKPYPYTESDGRENLNSTENRVLRGGSWDDDARYARAAYRNNDLPDNTDDVIGFRVVLLSAAPNSF